MAGPNRLVELDGPSWAAFRAGVRQLDSEGKKAIRDVHKSKAQKVVSAVGGEIPTRTGALARSVRAGATNMTGTIKAGGARVPYAPPIHWGWPRRGIRPQRFIIWGLAKVSRENGGFEQEYVDEILKLFDRYLPGSTTRG